ncbi:unnamed protein product [Diatraea saccharalis]|uniref:Reverse transcriptase domain-containing protein n=1 Tax=Diatraea saccharalis TaxID=40085 RepID=A0A9N9R205_9NEOP|nr:unnamed protein product [Diatraea saccharalis]
MPGNSVSHTRKLKGYVLTPLFFNLYMHDIPETQARKFIYADDDVTASQHETCKPSEETLNRDLLGVYFSKWGKVPNSTKNSPINSRVLLAGLDIQCTCLTCRYSDIQTMRYKSGTIKSTPLQWLSVLSHITPPYLRS